MARPDLTTLPPTLLLVYAILTGPKGRTMLRLALDTGASYTMLPPEKLALVGYAPHAATKTIEILTASGTEWTPVVAVASLRFLSCEAKHLQVVSHALPPTSPVEGLLGLNALDGFPPFRHFVKQVRLHSR